MDRVHSCGWIVQSMLKCVSLFDLQEKLEALSRDHHARVNELEVQVHQLRAKGEETVKRIRQLEQTNDDLERANR